MASNNKKLKVVTFNVQGLRNKKKRKTLFHLFRKENYDIIALQETCMLDSNTHIIKNEWGHKFHLSQGTNHSKGLLFLYGESINFDEINLLHTTDRFLISTLKLEKNE